MSLPEVAGLGAAPGALSIRSGSFLRSRSGELCRKVRRPLRRAGQSLRDGALILTTFGNALLKRQLIATSLRSRCEILIFGFRPKDERSMTG